MRCGALNPAVTRYCHQCGAPRRDVSSRLSTTGIRSPIRRLGLGWPFLWGRARRLQTVSAVLDPKLKSVRVAFLSARQALDVFEADVEFPGSVRAARFTEAVLVSILTLIGFLIRVWNVGSVPAGPAGDESAVALEVIRILNGEWIGIWSGAALGNPTGQMYWIAPFFWLGGPTLDMLRLSSVLLGAALIPMCFLMVRMLFPFRVAFVAAALLTFFTWFVIVYRIGFPVSLSVFMAVASLCLLVYAARSRRLWVALLAGLVLGLGLYSFKGYVIYFFAIWAAAMFALLMSRRLRGQWRLYVALAISLVIGAAMLEYYATSNFLAQNLHSQYGVEQSDLLSFPSYLSRIIELVSAIHVPLSPGGYGFDGIIPRPILPALYAIFFWIGLLVTFLFINRRPFQLLLLGWLIGMAPAILVPGGETRRYLMGVFFVLLIAGVGFTAIWHLLTTRWLFRRFGWSTGSTDLAARRAAFAVAMIASLLFIVPFAALNLYHFSQWPQSSGTRFQFPPDLAEAADFLNENGTEYEVRFYSARWPIAYETLRWLAPHQSGVNGATEFGGDGTIFSHGVVTQPTVFMLLAGYLHLIDDLKMAYPAGVEHVGSNDDGVPRLIAYTIDEPPAPGTVQVPLYYRLVPNPEETAFKVGVPATFVLRTNQASPVVLVFAASGTGTNFASHGQECPPPQSFAVEITDGETINIRACEPGTTSIDLYQTGKPAPIQQYHVTATSPTTSADASEFVILPDPSRLDIRAVPTEHHPLHLHSSRSALLIPHPAGSVVLHNNPDLQGRNGCELVEPAPEGDSRLLIILPGTSQETASPFFLVGCSAGQGALEVFSDGVAQQTYTFTVSTP